MHFSIEDADHGVKHSELDIELNQNRLEAVFRLLYEYEIRDKSEATDTYESPKFSPRLRPDWKN